MSDINKMGTRFDELYKYRIGYIILHYSVNRIDSTSTLWLPLFGKLEETFLGIKGEEYKNIIEKGFSNENKGLTLLNEKIKY